MKQKLLKLKDSGLFMVIVMLLCTLLGVFDGSAMTADAIALDKGGSVDTNAMTSVTDTRDRSENVILDDLDERVTKIRPHDVPLETIARSIDDQRVVGDGEKDATGQVVRHYAISTIELVATTTTAITDTGATQVVLETTDCKDLYILHK